jgi:hypothetical protein
VKLRVTYERAADLVADYDHQLTRGGLMVQVEPAAGLALGDPIELELVTPYGRTTLSGQVLHIMPGAGVACGFAADALAEVAGWVETARTASDGGGGPARHEIQPEVEDRPLDLHTRYRQASQQEKMQMALRGSRDERNILLRDQTAKSLHMHVLRNPQVQLDEIAAIAGMRTVAPDVLKYIAGRRDFVSRPDVASALVRNPKTPVTLAARLVGNLPQSELRQMVKMGGLREAILREARKRVL